MTLYELTPAIKETMTPVGPNLDVLTIGNGVCGILAIAINIIVWIKSW